MTSGRVEDKGISLPVNTLVILAIAVIVLLALVGFFMSSYSQTGETTSAQSNFRSQCTEEIITRGCCADTVECSPSDSLISAAKEVGVSEGNIIDACCELR